MINVLYALGGLVALGSIVYLTGCLVIAAFNAAITDSIGRGLNL